MVIRKLVEDASVFLNERIEEAIISVPAYFNDDQRWATKIAGQLAGIRVERIINEPSAAALSQHIQQTEEDMLALVVDFGGGTLDISIVEAFENVDVYKRQAARHAITFLKKNQSGRATFLPLPVMKPRRCV